MARISGIDLPRDKKVEIGLTYIFGIGRASAKLFAADLPRVAKLVEASGAKPSEAQ